MEAATLEHGLLHVDVVRPEPEKQVQTNTDPDGGLKLRRSPAFRPAELSGRRSVVLFKEAVMMTPTFTTEAFAALGAPALVYVRPIKASEIMDGAPGRGFEDLSPRPGPDPLRLASR